MSDIGQSLAAAGAAESSEQFSFQSCASTEPSQASLLPTAGSPMLATPSGATPKVPLPLFVGVDDEPTAPDSVASLAAPAPPAPPTPPAAPAPQPAAATPIGPPALYEKSATPLTPPADQPPRKQSTEDWVEVDSSRSLAKHDGGAGGGGVGGYVLSSAFTLGQTVGAYFRALLQFAGGWLEVVSPFAANTYRDLWFRGDRRMWITQYGEGTGDDPSYGDTLPEPDEDGYIHLPSLRKSPTTPGCPAFEMMPLRGMVQQAMGTGAPVTPPLKIVLVGDAGVGKTSILRCFARVEDPQISFEEAMNSPEPPVPPQPTIGVDVANKEMLVGDATPAGTPNSADGTRTSQKPAPLKVSLWDTAGDECRRTLTASYYANADAVVFVYDVSEPRSLSSIGTQWLAECEQYVSAAAAKAPPKGGGKPRAKPLKILLGNKADTLKEVPAPETLLEAAAISTEDRRAFDAHYLCTAMSPASVDEAIKTVVFQLKATALNPNRRPYQPR